MGAPWVDHPSFEVVAEASNAAGRDLSALLLDVPMEELTGTANAQLATFVQSLVVLRRPQFGRVHRAGGQWRDVLRRRDSARGGPRRGDGPGR
jgi:hypothetical protein